MAAQEGSKQYHVKISGPGVNLDTMIDAPTARVLMQIVMGGLTEPSSAIPQGAREQISLRDFVASSGAKTVAAQILAIAAFVCMTERRDEFTRGEIGDKFTLAGLAQPADLAGAFQAAADNGWIGEDPRALGHFFITKGGHEALRKKFAGIA